MAMVCHYGADPTKPIPHNLVLSDLRWKRRGIFLPNMLTSEIESRVVRTRYCGPLPRFFVAIRQVPRKRKVTKPV